MAVRAEKSAKSTSAQARATSIYQVKFYDGDYRPRQQKANADKAKLYVEQHFNSSSSAQAGYSVVIVGSNASNTSKNWGRWYAQAIAREFGTTVGGSQGILIGGFNGRGDGNVKHTDMPAILLEPLFASNPRHAAIIKSDDGQTRLARILVESIQRFLPQGGLVAFSIGHKGKTSAPNDRGAAVVGGGTEAEFAEKVLRKAQVMLDAIKAPEAERILRVMRGTQEVLRLELDEDEVLRLDAERNLLQILINE
jgi:hypothetical protein